MKESSGYSGTPLEKKLGLKPGFFIKLVSPPDNYFSFFDQFPTNCIFDAPEGQKMNFIHVFVTEKESLDDLLHQKKKNWCQMDPFGYLGIKRLQK